MIPIFLEGFLLQASLILALGAQNIFVLNSGLKKENHYFVAFICSLCDALLILLGVCGAATFFIKWPILKICFGILGVSFLFYYGLLKLKEALTNTSFSKNSEIKKSTLTQTFLTTLGFSLLNPHVYLDTVILIGGYSAKFPTLNFRLFFGIGASFFSFIWFFGLATLASTFSRILHNQKAMKMISLFSSLILLGLSFKLGKEVWGWMTINTL